MEVSTNWCVTIEHWGLSSIRVIIKIEEVRLDLFFFSLFYFIFNLFFHFLFLEQLGLGLIGHTVTTVT